MISRGGRHGGREVGEGAGGNRGGQLRTSECRNEQWRGCPTPQVEPRLQLISIYTHQAQDVLKVVKTRQKTTRIMETLAGVGRGGVGGRGSGGGVVVGKTVLVHMTKCHAGKRLSLMSAQHLRN